MRRIWRNNGLSIVLLVLFLVSLGGHAVTGHRYHNEEQRSHAEPTVAFGEYVTSDAFLESVMENWESEFLQMSAYVFLTVFLFQKGAADSKDPDGGKEEVDRAPDPAREGAPWPVRRGGLALALYRNSLSLALFTLFLVAFVLHARGGAGEYNAELATHGDPTRLTTLSYLGTSRFWFESLQNWQSEFLSIAVMVLLSVVLRQHGSPESKPVDAPHRETGS